MPTSEYTEKEKKQKDHWDLREEQFTSSVPIVGGLIVGFRNAWNYVATKWYVRSIVQQQNQYNRTLAKFIEDLHIQLGEAERENSQIVHDLAEIAATLSALNKSLDSLEKRISILENSSSDEGES